MPEKPRNPYFIAIWILVSVSFICNLIAFVCPYWIEQKSGSHNKFVSIGLWLSCFDGYMHDTLYQKAYYGCWYIFHKEYDAVRDWINPPWLFLVQVLAIISFICNVCNALIIGCQTCQIISTDNLRFLKLLMVSHAISILSLLTGLIGFGVQSQDSRWMPYPEKNTLSWAYGIEVAGFILSVVALAILFYQYLVITNPKEPGPEYTKPGEEYAENYEQPAVYDPRAPPPVVNTGDSFV